LCNNQTEPYEAKLSHVLASQLYKRFFTEVNSVLILAAQDTYVQTRRKKLHVTKTFRDDAVLTLLKIDTFCGKIAHSAKPIKARSIIFFPWQPKTPRNAKKKWQVAAKLTDTSINLTRMYCTCKCFSFSKILVALHG
jgi:hypothetical protein